MTEYNDGGDSLVSGGQWKGLNRTYNRRRSTPNNRQHRLSSSSIYSPTSQPPSSEAGRSVRRPSAPNAYSMYHSHKPPMPPQQQHLIFTVRGQEVRKRPPSRLLPRENCAEDNSSARTTCVENNTDDNRLLAKPNGSASHTQDSLSSSRLVDQSVPHENRRRRTDSSPYSGPPSTTHAAELQPRRFQNDAGEARREVADNRREIVDNPREVADNRRWVLEHGQRQKTIAEGRRHSSAPSLQSQAKTCDRIHYDRSFLLKLQFVKESLMRPTGLPQLPEIVLVSDSPTSTETAGTRARVQRRSSADVTTIASRHVRSQSSMNGRASASPAISSGRGQPPSRQNSVPSTREARKVIRLSLQQSIQLHTSEQAWRPSCKAEVASVESSECNEKLYHSILGILNKLTPTKFKKLVAKVRDLDIDTEEKLCGCIDIIFEKAINEPGFSAAYAGMAKCLINLEVPMADNPEKTVTFGKLLLNRCQAEFEKDKMAEIDIEKMQQQIDAADTDDSRALLLAEKELAEFSARKRSTGNIQFIGELFKLRVLSEGIMHGCIERLLRSADSDNLERLCRLLSTIGEYLDSDKSKPLIDEYFRQFQQMIDSGAMCSRIRFMIIDLIDLRKHCWVPRHEVNHPKLIREIQGEVGKEKKEESLQRISQHQKLERNSSFSSPSQDNSSPCYSVSRIADSADGGESVNLRMCRSSSNGNEVFAPDGRMAIWQKGCGSRTPSLDKDNFSGNSSARSGAQLTRGQSRDSKCESRDSSRGPARDRKGEGRYAREDSRDTRGQDREEGRDWRRPRGSSRDSRNDIPSVGPLKYKSIAIQSMERERSAAIAAVRSIVARSTSVDQARTYFSSDTLTCTSSNDSDGSGGCDIGISDYIPEGLTSRDGYVTSAVIRNANSCESRIVRSIDSGYITSAENHNVSMDSEDMNLKRDIIIENSGRVSSFERQEDSLIAVHKVSTNVVLASDENMEIKNRSILEEFLNIHSFAEVELCVKELDPDKHLVRFVVDSVMYCLGQSIQVREDTGRLLNYLVQHQLITFTQYRTGVQEVLESAEDLQIDIPKIWQYLGELVGAMVDDRSRNLQFLRDLCESVDSRCATNVCELICHVLHAAARRLGNQAVGELWMASGLNWTEFLPANKIKSFLEQHDLEFTEFIQPVDSRSSNDAMRSHLDMLLVSRASDADVISWIQKHVPATDLNRPPFIRMLMTVVCVNSIQIPTSGMKGAAQLDKEGFISRCKLLATYLEGKTTLQLHALYALQACVHQLDHPPGVLRMFFDTLYDEEVICEAVFYQWRDSTDQAEQQGKGVARTSVRQFYTWLAGGDEA